MLLGQGAEKIGGEVKMAAALDICRSKQLAITSNLEYYTFLLTDENISLATGAGGYPLYIHNSIAPYFVAKQLGKHAKVSKIHKISHPRSRSNEMKTK